MTPINMQPFEILLFLLWLMKTVEPNKIFHFETFYSALRTGKKINGFKLSSFFSLPKRAAVIPKTNVIYKYLNDIRIKET